MIPTEIKRLNALNPIKQFQLVKTTTGQNLVQRLNLPNGSEEHLTLIFDVTDESFATYFGLTGTVVTASLGAEGAPPVEAPLPAAPTVEVPKHLSLSKKVSR